MADSTTTVPQISQSQRQKEVTSNENDNAAFPSMAFGRNPVTSAALTWGWMAGNVSVDGEPQRVAAGTVLLTASDTSYIYLEESGSPATMAVVASTSEPSGWPGPMSGKIALYEVVVGTVAPTSWVDKRVAIGVGGSAGGGSGTVTSVAATVPTDILSVSGSPVTGSGTLAISKVNQNANLVFAGPTTGGAAAPAFRSLVAADLPAQKCVIQMAVSDETTAITTGTAKLTFRMPHAMTLTEVRASLTASSSSGNPTVDINEGGSTILSTKLSIDSGELTSTTAATPAVISDASLADDAEITIDIDTAGTGAKGLKVALIGTRVA